MVSGISCTFPAYITAMGVAIRIHKKHRINSPNKPNRDLLSLPKMCSKKMQSEDPCSANQRPSCPQKNQFCLDGDLLSEVLKYVDGRSLARASCVNRQWHKAAQDEKLWENICLRHWANIGCGHHQLRSVVLALGGFRRLYAICIWPLLNPSSSSSSSSAFNSQTLLPPIPSQGPSRKPAKTQCWGKDEFHLSLSLFSIHCYEKINSVPLGNLSATPLKASKHPIFENPNPSLSN